MGMNRARSGNAMLRFALMIASFAYIGLTMFELHGQWLFEHPTAANLERGARWHGSDARWWTVYGNHWSFEDPGKARDAYLNAARRSPLEWANWEGLANAYLQLGETGKAEAAARAGVIARPSAPLANWRLANLLLVRGRQQEAIPHLQVAASQRDMRPAVFELGWKILNSPQSILATLVPNNLEGRLDYLDFLVHGQRLAAGYEVWQQLRSSRDPAVQPAARAYLAALVNEGLSSDAARLWGELLEDSGRKGARPPGDLITNGDFEFDSSKDMLDWALSSGEGREVRFDKSVAYHGSRSLQVVFDGTANVDAVLLSQVVTVEPDRSYKFRGYIKTENITSDSGLQFCISSYGAPAADTFGRCGAGHIGGTLWTEEQIDFRTRPSTGFVHISLRRFASKRFNNLIRGRVWIDGLSLRETR